MAFMIIGKDGPMYELDMGSLKKDEAPRSAQFVIHAALDMVDIKQWTSPSIMLGAVDAFGPSSISAYVTPGGIRLMMMTDASRPEETLRYFCSEVHGLYLKLLLNPFYKPQSRIESAEFDDRVRALARKYLGFRDAP